MIAYALIDNRKVEFWPPVIHAPEPDRSQESEQKNIALTEKVVNLNRQLGNINLVMYHTGERNKGFGRYFSCSERSNTLSKVCGNQKGLNQIRTNQHPGDHCGHNYYVAACTSK